MSIETANFVALDFETANADLSSICQVGIVVFSHGKPVDSLSMLVDPEDYFSDINISIHGIDQNSVYKAEIFPNIYSKMMNYLHGRVVVSHSPFDRAALRQAEAKYGIPASDCRWLDTTRVVRRHWPRYARSGYGLANLAEEFGIEFRHHDAAEDARGTGLILSLAVQESAISLDEWLIKAHKPLSEVIPASDSQPDGPLHGDVVVFTGALSIPRREAAVMASKLGLRVDDGVTNHTTLLVVGDQDIRQLAPGKTKSSKHQKVEQLIKSGHSIRILRETDFTSMFGCISP